MEQLLITTITILFFPVACLLLLVVLLASIGKSLGLRKKYVQFLLKVFEFGQHKIEKAQQKQENPDDETEEEVDSDDEGKRVIRRDISVSLDGLKFHAARTDLVLEDKKDFHISDAMYFAKCGMEAVIEDDVTKCFTAEELKSWNFLTRTTQGHQFISVRLTILWCLGFLFRYCFLVPM
ncbi:glycerol-3-phosphate O-acyltransferase 3/4, partial [Mytilus galloprovincialis]